MALAAAAGRALEPNVSAEALQAGRVQASLAFSNAGPGLAVQLMYMLVCGGEVRQGLVEKGFLGGGEHAHIDLGPFVIKSGEEAYLMWACNDVNLNVFLWSLHGDRRRYSRRRWKRHDERPSLPDMFRVYPDVAITE